MFDLMHRAIDEHGHAQGCSIGRYSTKLEAHEVMLQQAQALANTGTRGTFAGGTFTYRSQAGSWTYTYSVEPVTK